MDDKQRHPPPEGSDDGSMACRNFWPIFLVPIILALINPTTGVYIVDVLILASPMLVALVLLFFFLTSIRELLLKYVDEKIHSTRIFVAVFLIASFAVSFSVGFFIEGALRKAALKHFGEAQAYTQHHERLH